MYMAALMPVGTVTPSQLRAEAKGFPTRCQPAVGVAAAAKVTAKEALLLVSKPEEATVWPALRFTA